MTFPRWLESEVTLNSKPSWFIYVLFANFEANKHITTMLEFLIAVIIRASVSGDATPVKSTTTPVQEQCSTYGGSGGWDERD